MHRKHLVYVNRSPDVMNAWKGGKFLFPDAAVFSVSEKIRPEGNGLCYSTDYESAVNIDEVLSVHAHIREMIKKFSSPKYLTESEIADILGMESEKYRRRLMGL